MNGEYHIGGCIIYTEDRLRDILQYAMQRNGLSIHRLAQYTGISDGTIRSWLRGEHTIKYDRIEAIFAYLDEGYRNVQ